MSNLTITTENSTQNLFYHYKQYFGENFIHSFFWPLTNPDFLEDSTFMWKQIRFLKELQSFHRKKINNIMAIIFLPPISKTNKMNFHCIHPGKIQHYWSSSSCWWHSVRPLIQLYIINTARANFICFTSMQGLFTYLMFLLVSASDL